MQNTANIETVELRCSINTTDQHLQINYEIINRSPDDIYVFDGMFHLDNGPVMDNSLVYTIIEGDTLTIFRGVLRIPEGVQVEAPEMPFARLLRAGDTLSGIVDAKLPLLFHHPYVWDENKGTHEVSNIRLRLGYISKNTIGVQPEARIFDKNKMSRFSYRDVVERQRTVEKSYQYDVNFTITH